MLAETYIGVSPSRLITVSSSGEANPVKKKHEHQPLTTPAIVRSFLLLHNQDEKRHHASPALKCAFIEFGELGVAHQAANSWMLRKRRVPKGSKKSQDHSDRSMEDGSPLVIWGR